MAGIRTGAPIDKRIYDIWRGMHSRCENEHHKFYKHYGARGITVCEEWNSLILFGKWALDNGYADDLTLDRIDANGNYEPSNCQWATKEQQNANRRVGRHVHAKIESNIVKTKSFNVRQRKDRWEYRIPLGKIDGKRKEISKSGFLTKEEATQAAELYIRENMPAFCLKKTT